MNEIYLSSVTVPTHNSVRSQNLHDDSLSGTDICIKQIYVSALIFRVMSATSIPVSSKYQLI